MISDSTFAHIDIHFLIVGSSSVSDYARRLHDTLMDSDSEGDSPNRASVAAARAPDLAHSEGDTLSQELEELLAAGVAASSTLAAAGAPALAPVPEPALHDAHR